MKTYREIPKQYVGFITDHSYSMSLLRNAAMRDYNSNITTLVEETNKHKLDTIIFSVLCGAGDHKNNLVARGAVNSTVNLLEPITRYEVYGRTPLFDSVGELITLMESVPDADSPNASFLIIAITDGLENASMTWNAGKLRKKIAELAQSDRWTFTFRTPIGSAAALQRDLGIPAGNFYEWDATKAGLEKSHKATVQSVRSFYSSRVAGATSTKSFYTDLTNVTPTQVKRTLDDITSEVTAFTITTKFHNSEIKEFIKSRRKGAFVIGAGFYELTKREKVQSYKQVIIQDLGNKKFYGGQAARKLIGLSTASGAIPEAVKVNPGDHANYKIFIQSTSVNRKLKENTQLVYWPSVSVPNPTTASRRY